MLTAPTRTACVGLSSSRSIFDRGHVHAFAGKAEDLAHADAVVVVGPRRVGRPQCLQPFDELRGGVSH